MIPQNNGESDCAVCGGSGWVLDRENNRTWPCECKEPTRTYMRLKRAGIPARFAECALENFCDRPGLPALKAAEAREAVLQISESWPKPQNGLLFMGPCGTGKTHLAVALLKRIVKKGGEGRFLDYQEFLLGLQDAINKNESEETFMAPFIECDLLLLDDLGARRLSEFAIDSAAYLLNKRYSEMRLTILTTNYPDDGGITLSERISVRIRSRLDEMCRTIKLVGTDFRRELQ